MLRRIFVYGILAVAGVGVISMAGVLRNRAAAQADAGDSYSLAVDTACCPGATCAGTSPCCAGAKCPTATAVCTGEPKALSYSAVETGTADGACQTVQFGQTITGIIVDDTDALVQRPCGIDLIAVEPSFPVDSQSADGPCTIRNFRHIKLALDPSQANPVDCQLQAVRTMLSTKSELSPSEEQIKAAIDNYFLVNQVDAAITMLTKIVADAPQSVQGKRAKAAIELLRAADSVPPAPYESRGSDERREAESPIPEPPIPMP